ncbi:CIA30 family protein [Polaribacter cellanae]|uniref:CIA30 family protein n=1 Tax=Polaribacter cellanae TaxID=2818493 RepID=A0A975CQN2_9FLAO|nr:CIA30 family protein [Polaribacter cellanae]QTE23933.1 CIA30 family protein [Polaribacter cellanae]
MSETNKTIFDFNLNSDVSQWKVVDDVVMGGRSNGNFKINKKGDGVFYGDVSLENNGGFSLLRYRFSSIKVKDFKEVVLKVKGDKKKYQFRVKDKTTNYYSFILTFETNGAWQTIKIPLAEMEPAFRGRKLKMDNFSSESVEELAFLIGNKKEQHFKLEIDKIYLQ